MQTLQMNVILFILCQDSGVGQWFKRPSDKC